MTAAAEEKQAHLPPSAAQDADAAPKLKRIVDLVTRNEAPVKVQYIRRHDTSATPQPGAPAASTAATTPAGAARTKDKGKGGAKGGGNDVCINHFLGSCTYGDKCRFSHDVQAYLAMRPPDLPGTCPFINTGTCPYGIGCRFASTHTATDELHTLLLSFEREQKQQAGAGGAVGAAAATDPAAAYGAVPSTVLLPTPDKVEAPFNSMSKDLQRLLWKNRYDFTKADRVLKDLGIKVSTRPAKPLPGEDKGSGKGKQQQVHGKAWEALGVARTVGAGAAEQGMAGTMAAAQDTAAQPMEAEQQQLAAAPQQAGHEDKGEKVAGTGEPERKRARLDGNDAAVADADTGVAGVSTVATAGTMQENAAMHMEVPLRREEKRAIDFRGKTVLAPLTTVGNLPYRRVCKKLGADVTVGEMALATNLLQGQASEWALLKRHPCEDLFGVQIAGGFPDTVARACQLIDETCTSVDYVDINMGCPIDIVCDRGAGSALLLRPKRIAEIAKAADRSMSLPLTLKTRKGYHDDQDVTHTFVSEIRAWGPIALTLHGRTRQQRYSKTADWNYIQRCAELAQPTGLQLIGNGDVFSYVDWLEHVGNGTGPLSSCMVGRGALIKPWVFTEIKEQRHWDISASERLDLLRDFCSAGLTHWGSDGRGVQTTRRFLLEWLSYLHRYIPVGLLEVVPQKLQWRQPNIYGRNDLETLLSSENPVDWIRISEMLLGRAPEGFTFTPKHKSTSYAPPTAGTSSQADEQDGQAEG